MKIYPLSYLQSSMKTLPFTMLPLYTFGFHRKRFGSG